MMKFFLKTLLAAVLLSGCFSVATAETMTGYNVNTVAVPLNDGYGLTVESIEFRNDLTRVNCKLKGTQHIPSNRQCLSRRQVGDRHRWGRLQPIFPVRGRRCYTPVD